MENGDPGDGVNAAGPLSPKANGKNSASDAGSVTKKGSKQSGQGKTGEKYVPVEVYCQISEMKSGHSKPRFWVPGG
jgi:hypothetical protein